MHNQLSSIEHAIARHDAEIEKVRDNFHTIDKNLTEFRAELKKERELYRGQISNLSNKIDNCNCFLVNLDQTLKDKSQQLEERVQVLENLHEERKRWLSIAFKFIKFAGKTWWFWFLLIVCFFAFDIKFEVQNPHLVSLLSDAIRNRL